LDCLTGTETTTYDGLSWYCFLARNGDLTIVAEELRVKVEEVFEYGKLVRAIGGPSGETALGDGTAAAVVCFEEDID